MKIAMPKVAINKHFSMGTLWFIGWLFTIGFLKLSFGRGLLALIIWPYYIGTFIAGIIR